MTNQDALVLIDLGYLPPRIRQNAPEQGWDDMEAIRPDQLMSWAVCHPHGVWMTHHNAGFVYDFSSAERLMLEKCWEASK